jgi:hypothetical protein
MTELQKIKLHNRIRKYTDEVARIDWELRQPVNRGSMYTKMFNKARLLEFKIEELKEKLQIPKL